MIGINLGKNKETPLEEAAADYIAVMDVLADKADYLVVNVSSPNTPGLRDLQTRAYLESLLKAVVARRNALAEDLQRTVPLLVKLAPDLDVAGLNDAIEAIDHAGVDGVIATNTTIARDGLKSPRASEAGGLSGDPLTARSTEMVAQITRLTAGRLPVIACGGIMSVDDARAKIDAGASLVQLYTGLIYEGPGLARQIAAAL